MPVIYYTAKLKDGHVVHVNVSPEGNVSFACDIYAPGGSDRLCHDCRAQVSKALAELLERVS